MAKTVLIVEDERAIVEILKFNLKREGYETLEALDGETVDEFVDSGSDVVTPDNAQERLDTLKTQLH